MIDVSEKKITKRIAVALGAIKMKKETLTMIKEKKIPKGDCLEVARVAAISAAKQTHQLIPMCHPLKITGVRLEFDLKGTDVRIQAEVSAIDRTGVEMEALTAVSVAALTIYDMCKRHDRKMVIGNIYLAEKSGGRSGHWKANSPHLVNCHTA